MTRSWDERDDWDDWDENGREEDVLSWSTSWPGALLTWLIHSVTALIVSCQVVLGTFFLSILGIKHTRHPVTAAPARVSDESVNHREQSAAAPRL